MSVIQAQQHQVPHVTPDGRHRCHHFIAAQGERAPGYSSVAYTWQQGCHHFIAEQRETFRLFISCLHLTTSSAERDPQVIHQLLTPYDRESPFHCREERDHQVIHQSLTPDDGEITVSLQQIQITGLVISHRWLFYYLSVQVEVMCLSNYSTSFKAKRLTLWMPTDQQSVRHNWWVRFQFLCWLYHLKDNW